MNRSIRKSFLIILATLILSLSGCGIPNIYIPSSSDVYHSSSRSEITLYGDMANPGFVEFDYPRLYLFYQIVPTGDYSNSGFSSVISEFNKKVSREENGQPISIKRNQPYLTYNYSIRVDDEALPAEYGIFQFTDASGNTISSFDTAKLFSNGNPFTWNYSFELDTDGILTFKLSNNNNPTVDIIYNLKRNNGYEFNNSSSSFVGVEIPSIFFSDASITNYDLRVYCLVSAKFNGYNNIYNTSLMQLYSQTLSI